MNTSAYKRGHSKMHIFNTPRQGPSLLLLKIPEKVQDFSTTSNYVFRTFL